MQRQAVNRDIDDELRFHVDQRTVQNITAGMSAEDAARDARQRFGNWLKFREECREVRGVNWIENFLQDFRFGLRLWIKKPGSFLSAVIALTLGIGLVAFSFSAILCVFFGRLPFQDQDRIVYTSIAGPTFSKFAEQQTSFEELSAFSLASMNFKALDVPSRQQACLIGANFLDLVRVKPLQGRGFLQGDEKAGAEPVALIGYDLWQREFHGDSAAVGSSIRLDGKLTTVVGIMPKGFKFPIKHDLWLPAEPGSAAMSGWGYSFGRLRPGVSIGDARAELNLIDGRIAASMGHKIQPDRILVGPYTRADSGLKGAYGPAPTVIAMLLMTLLVLFIACANVAGLTFANATKRGTEFAIRSALGAARARLITQLLIESLILAIAGTVGGVSAVAWLTHWAMKYMERDDEFAQAPFWIHIGVDGRLLLGAIGLTLFTTLLAGLWPAVQVTKRDVNELLKAQTNRGSGMRIGKFQRLLVIVQIACSVVILTQSFVMLGFSRRLKELRLPFDPKTILTAQVEPQSSADTSAFFTELERDLTALPGVQGVALSTGSPVSLPGPKQIGFEGITYQRPEDLPYVGQEVVSTGYFTVLNIPLLQGRGFTADDVSGSTPVAIVNATFAKQFLPPGTPLGRRFREGTGAWMTIVGCVADVNPDPTRDEPQPVYFRPLAQQPLRSVCISLHGTGAATDWIKSLRTEVAHLEPDLPLYHVVTAQFLIDHDIVGYHLASALLLVCGGGALFLATLGICGLITLSVNQRTRETGIRLALGASRSQVVHALLKQVVRQILAGLAIGAMLAFALTTALTHAIAGYPVARHPGLVYLATIAVLGGVSVIAVLIPAIQGARVAPMQALRYE
jgi:predicted permease